MKPKINTLGELKKSGYQVKSIKTELRENLITSIKKKKNPFVGILGYEDSVVPDIERAILSRHNINLLGLRGQAKTRIARQMTELLDEYIPVVKGSELNDDPLLPLTRFAIDLIAEHGDNTPIDWLHRSERYSEKLATPDVSVADLIGDVDPIKAANLKLPYSDERTLHFGLIPRSNRCIFVINELPDLQPRIQVSLFNILQEGDIQIRGFKIRLPLDIQFVFTANPEDYTNRGSIVTPLKDRIGSQILTHYPKEIETSMQITLQEARITEQQKKLVSVSTYAHELMERVGFEARSSEYVDSKSGVSARLSISCYENLVSAAERRAIINNEITTSVRITDFVGIIPSITGKVELVYEGEQEGPQIVAQHLLGKAIKTMFADIFPMPDKLKKSKEENPYAGILKWFSDGGSVDLLSDMTDQDYYKNLNSVPGLVEVVKKNTNEKNLKEIYFFCELILHGLAEYSKITKSKLLKGFSFKDTFNSVFDLNNLAPEN
ncbi:MAG: magnesium chelatase [Bacteroidota bacterium]|jgi:magnesium chelatase subunit I